MNIREQNRAARSLHHRLGYEEEGIGPCDFNCIEGISLVPPEKVLRP